jgi:hypothetical protein
VTEYFAEVRRRPDRAIIRDEWIEAAIRDSLQQLIQADGRNGMTVHNAFFDRRFKP